MDISEVQELTDQVEYPILTKQLIAQYCDLKAELEPLQEQLKELYSHIREQVLEDGPVETDRATVSIRQGYIRPKWDDKGLRGYAVAYPEVMKFLTEIETRPTISIKVL